MADLAGIDRKTLYEVMSCGLLKFGMMDIIKTGTGELHDKNICRRIDHIYRH